MQCGIFSADPICRDIFGWDEAEDAFVDWEHDEPSIGGVELSRAVFSAEPATEAGVANLRLAAVEAFEERAEDAEVVEFKLDVCPVCGKRLRDILCVNQQGHSVPPLSFGECQHAFL